MSADDSEDEGPVPTQTGVIAQLTDNDGGNERAGVRRKRRKPKRPIGFQLGELGHLDRPVKDD
jgi:hypothetical protein